MIERLDFNMKDVFRLEKLEKQCFGKEAWSVNALCGELQNDYSYMFAVRDGEEILGYACVRIMLEEAQICNIAVRPDARRRGTATELINALLDFSREKGALWAELEVNTDNTAAIALYEKCGFQKAGLRKNFYRRTRFDSRDAYTMKLDL